MKKTKELVQTSDLYFLVAGILFVVNSVIKNFYFPESQWSEWFTPFVTMLFALAGCRLRMNAQRAEHDWAEHQRSIEEAKNNRASYTREVRFPNTPSNSNRFLADPKLYIFIPLTCLLLPIALIYKWNWLNYLGNFCVIFIVTLLSVYCYQVVREKREWGAFIKTLREQISLLDISVMSAGKIGKLRQRIEYAKMVAPDSFSDEEIEIWRNHQRKANEPQERMDEVSAVIEVLEKALYIAYGRIIPVHISEGERTEFQRMCKKMIDNLPAG